jgi:hypothetical protein
MKFIYLVFGAIFAHKALACDTCDCKSGTISVPTKVDVRVGGPKI